MAKPTQSELELEPEPGFQHFAGPEPGSEYGEPAPEPISEPEADLEPADETSVTVEPTESERLGELLAESQRREVELNRKLDEERSRLDRFIEQPREQAEPRVDPYNAPDPIADPEGYKAHNAALHLQAQRDTQRQIQQAQSELTEQNTLASLWTQFQQKYPDMAALDDLAGVAFQRVVPNGVIPQDTNRLIDDVHAKMLELSGRQAGSQDTPTKPANRTGGVAGGTAAPTRPARKGPEEEPTSTLADALFKVQHEQMGIV